MSIETKLKDDLKDAMRNKNTIKKNVITMIKADIQNESIELKRDLTDDEILTIIGRKLKQTKDALIDFHKAERDDLIVQAEIEIRILESYLPKQLSAVEIELIVEETIQEVGITQKANKGVLMKHLMPKVKGKADGKLVGQIVDKLLEG